MKSIMLGSKQIASLLKVLHSGWKFYSDIEEFLENNREIEDESIELAFNHIDYLNDMIKMIESYLKDDGLSDEDYPSDHERMELIELCVRLKE
jgi:hypothetical protein